MRLEELSFSLSEAAAPSPRDRIADTALTYFGRPSHAPLGTPDDMSLEMGFSCSGLVTQVVIEAGIHRPAVPLIRNGCIVVAKPRKVIDYYQACRDIPWEERQRNDLVIFMKPDKLTAVLKPWHIGVVLNTDGGIGDYIHAPGWDGSKVSIVKAYDGIRAEVLETPFMIPDYMQIRRVPDDWLT